MFDIIIGALLPVAIILILGFIAGARQDFNKDQAGIFNQMVMSYAFPLCLFSAIVVIPVHSILDQADLAVGLFGGMILMYIIVLLTIRYLFKQNIRISALLTLSITCPSAAFVGMPILSMLEGTSESSISVAIVSIYMNLIQVPITIILLNTKDDNETNSKSKLSLLRDNIVVAIRKPLVWAPVLALAFAMLRIELPEFVLSAFDLLGKATAGVALFASGIILYSYKIKINLTVVLTVIARNIVVPFLVWGIALWAGFPKETIREIVLTLAIPIASIAIILAIQYKEGEQVVATSFFLSTILALVTMGLFIALLPS